MTAQRVRDYVEPFFGAMLLGQGAREDVRCQLPCCEDAGLIERTAFPRQVMPRFQERPPDRLTDEGASRIMAPPKP